WDLGTTSYRWDLGTTSRSPATRRSPRALRPPSDKALAPGDAPMEITELLDQASAATVAVARGVRADQLTNPTPCSEWDVHQLMDNMTGSYPRFAARAAGQPAGPPGQPAVTTGHQDAIDQLVAAASAAGAAWQQPGALDRMTASPLGELPGRFG